MIWKKWVSKFSHAQMIAMGFLLIILTGSLLLMLPISSREGIVTSFMECFFTATSATCVTGLVVVDTYVHWSLFGQIIILIMIQIGGLGFMTIGVMFSVAVHRKINLKTRGMLSESLNTLQIGGVIRLLRKIIVGTFLVEGIGAILLSIRFCSEFGFIRGIYYGIFHSISAFCNAGFDLMGFRGEYSSLMSYSGDWLVTLTISALIIFGGIGFLVWDDLTKHRWHFRKYRLHTKLVLIVSGVLLIGGTLLFLVFERTALPKDMGAGERFLVCFFDAVTPRTAGFSTYDLAQVSEAGKLLTLILMFIGGSSGSTAGGVKTTTIAVFFLYLLANVRRTRGVTIFRRRLADDTLKRAGAIVCMNITLALVAALVICGGQGLDLRDVALETVSAISTVGMSAGITRDLNQVSRLMIVLLMYLGRVGGISVLFSFSEMKKKEPFEYPEEKILIG